MNNVQVDVITPIPDEIKLFIFQHLDSFSVINLEKVSTKFAELCLDKKLSSNLCFYKDYRFKLIHFESFVLNTLRKEIITSLNINCVYWIPKKELKKCLSLRMLQSLYALDTKLNLNDVCVSHLPNLNVLAITHYSNSLRVGCNVLPRLKKLYIQYESIMYAGDFISCIFKDCICLEDLWLLDVWNTWLEFDINTAPNNLKRFVTNSHTCFSFTLCQNPTFNVTFMSNRYPRYISYENTDMSILSNIYQHDFYENLENVLWRTYLNELGCDPPFGLHDAKKLVCKQETLDSLYFQELSLTHDSDLCREKVHSTVVSILTLPNTKLLRKLSIDICIFSDHSKTSDRRSTTDVCMKRSKLDIIVEHLPLLEELEIWNCNSMTKWNTDVLWSIGKLSKLKSLVLYYISDIDEGRYLPYICESCVNLTSLKVWSLQCTYHNLLCMSIRYLRMLKDLRFEQRYLPLDRILQSLNCHDLHTLERVVFACHETETFSSELLKQFITQNPQLKLFYMAVTKLPKETRGLISKVLEEMKSDQQCFIITNDVTKFHLLPLIHKLEMVHVKTSVGVVHPFNDFQ